MAAWVVACDPMPSEVKVENPVAQASAKETQQVVLEVSGMTCQSCPQQVAEILAKVDGVTAVETSRKDRTAKVTFDPRKTYASRLVEAVNRSERYRAKVR